MKSFNLSIFQFGNKNKGFTLIELLVAMSLFVVLIAVAVTGFIQLMRGQRVIVSLMAANDNMSLALEQMTREIRTGYNFSKVSETEFQFVNANNFDIRYRLNNGAIEKGTGFLAWDPNNPNPNLCAGGEPDYINGFCYKKITADNVKIDKFNFDLFGNNQGDGYPPRITIRLSVSSAEPDVQRMNISIPIQTTISARTIDS
ncbi:MAG: type II secretion system protein [Patescibacteria group bacterium]|nr:type II secretion system protein [Patescibacteria group bacterium]